MHGHVLALGEIIGKFRAREEVNLSPDP
jgi:hypothetical protein